LAVSRLEMAINNQEGVMVYGDYDVMEPLRFR
jgi:single-stranded DNA-specific DHH superfamily exonuclease